MSKIDEVAAAIAELIAPALSGGKPVKVRDVARAAIEAMRIPSESMVLAGLNCDAWSDAEGGAVEMLSGTFTSMIDAALKEPKP